MSIREPISFQIAYNTWCITEFGMDTQFLIVGDEKALLIDTGTGAYNIPAYLSSLTDKPIMCALTHGHVDHAGGISWFPEVYLHEDDFDMAKSVSVEERADYVKTMLSMSDGLYDLSPESVVNGSCEPALKPLKEGDVIHLGGRDVVVYETPGHTLGSISFLDVRERIIITGDACNVNTLLACTADSGSDKGTLSALLASARKIESLHPFWDRNYNGHVGYAGWISHLDPMAESLTREAIELCEQLLSGEKQGEVFTENPFVGPCLVARNKNFQVLYKENQIR